MIRQFIKTRVRYVLKKLEWKRRFPGRTTVGKYSFGFDNIAVGTGTYGEISVLTSDPNPSLTLGRYCSIAREVVFVTGNEHPMDRLSTYPFRVLTLGRKGCEATSKGGIVVEDDVWIGFRATILDGVKIGQGGLSLPVQWSPRRCRPTRSSRESPRGPSGRGSTRARSATSLPSTTRRSTAPSSSATRPCSTLLWMPPFLGGC